MIRTTRLFETAGQHFNRGQRALLRARLSRLVHQPLGAVRHDGRGRHRIWRRQFASNAWRRWGAEAVLALGGAASARWGGNRATRNGASSLRREIARGEVEVEHLPLAVAIAAAASHRAGRLAARSVALCSSSGPFSDAVASISWG